jgi:hypothetical protein
VQESAAVLVVSQSAQILVLVFAPSVIKQSYSIFSFKQIQY